MSEVHKDLPVLALVDQAKWEAWLRVNHTEQAGVWIKFAKKGSGIKSISYEQAREGAIKYGWIDGLINRYGERFFVRRFTPRRSRSKWSQINRAIAEELIASGKMQPAGLTEVERAQADGRWDAAYPSPANIQPHPELAAALAASPKAKRFYQTVDRTNRYSILYHVHDAKRAETRARRIAKYIAMLEAGELPHPPPAKS